MKNILDLEYEEGIIIKSLEEFDIISNLRQELKGEEKIKWEYNDNIGVYFPYENEQCSMDYTKSNKFILYNFEQFVNKELDYEIY